MADLPASELIESLGGAKVVAEKTTYRRGTVDTWGSREIIPRKAWPDLMIAFPQLGMSDLIGSELAYKAAVATKQAQRAAKRQVQAVA